MKSKKEIEEYLGMKIEPYYIREVESIYGEEQIAETTIGLDYDKMIEEDLEYTRTHQTYQPSQVVENHWNRVN